MSNIHTRSTYNIICIKNTRVQWFNIHTHINSVNGRMHMYVKQRHLKRQENKKILFK